MGKEGEGAEVQQGKKLVFVDDDRFIDMSDMGNEDEEEIQDESVPLYSSTETTDSVAATHKLLEKKKQELLDSKVKHWGITFSDGEKMTALKNQIRESSEYLTGDVPTDAGGFSTALEALNASHGQLYNKVRDYVDYIEGSKKGRSGVGEYRLNLARDLLEMISSERTFITNLAKSDVSSLVGRYNTWNELLYDARAVVVSPNDKNVKIVGGAISSVMQRKNADGSTSYIKKEEKLSKNGTVAEFFDQYKSDGGPEADAILVAFFSEDPEGKQLRRVVANLANIRAQAERETVDLKSSEHAAHIKNALNTGLKGLLDKYYPDNAAVSALYAKSRTAVEGFCSYVMKKAIEDNMTQLAGIKRGSSMSDRNVATSRMAEQFGIGNIVAKSETVSIIKDDGSRDRANTMEGVEGKTYRELVIDAHLEGRHIKLSPNAVMQLYCLQVFDLICGQIDRHRGNIIVSYRLNDNMYIVDSIKAIDNDISFGELLTYEKLNEIKEIKGEGDSTQVRGVINARAITDPKGRVTVPYLPRDFYNKILSYEPEIGDYKLKDIRSDNEIQAMNDRLIKIKNELIQLVKSGKIVLLNSESEWEDAYRRLLAKKELGQLANGYVNEHHINKY